MQPPPSNMMFNQMPNQKPRGPPTMQQPPMMKPPGGMPPTNFNGFPPHQNGSVSVSPPSSLPPHGSMHPSGANQMNQVYIYWVIILHFFELFV